MQLDAGLNPPDTEAVKSTVPVGALPDVLVTVAVHVVVWPVPVIGPVIGGSQLTFVLVIA